MEAMTGQDACYVGRRSQPWRCPPGLAVTFLMLDPEEPLKSGEEFLGKVNRWFMAAQSNRYSPTSIKQFSVFTTGMVELVHAMGKSALQR